MEHNSTLTAELELVGAGRKVLEIGPGSGHLTEALAKRNCQVTCIEVDANLTSIAHSFCERMIVGDVESLNPEEAFPGERFDVIILGDVLEHLKHPEMVLRKLKNYLQPAGYLVLSLPNVAHASVRLALLNGDFNYSEEGIIDRTHLRFFTLATIVALAREAGYQILELRRTRVGVFNTEVKLSIENVSVSVLRKLMRDPEATTYQFIFAAAPQKEEQCGGEVEYGPSHFVDRTWSVRKGKHRLARSLMRKGRALLREHDRRAARVWLYRSFMLQPRMQTFMYLVLTWTPRFGFSAR
ncbi:MAG TPA: class I SAM-dependent methyltransferase [Candidatus Limnocylindrales bacterium]|nr:class I SAM-dependent methyltransferase [Candidatus Limnocylindrales bacterium]